MLYQLDLSRFRLCPVFASSIIVMPDNGSTFNGRAGREPAWELEGP